MKTTALVLVLLLTVAFGAIAQGNPSSRGSQSSPSNAELGDNIIPHSMNGTDQSYIKVGFIYLAVALILGLIWAFLHHNF